MRRFRPSPLPVLLLLFLVPPLHAQDIGARLGVLAGENARGYVGPLARGLGHALTAGMVSSARPQPTLGFSLGVRAVGSLFPGADETFTVALPGSVTYEHPLFGSRTYADPYAASNGGRSPTVAGQGAGALLTPTGSFREELILAGRNPDSEAFTIRFPEGLDFPLAPFAVVEGSLGIGFGTQLTARLIPTIDVGALAGVDEIGDLSAFGFGVMHSLSQHLPIPTPFWDLSVTAGTQKLELGNYAEATGKTIGLVGSVGLGPLSGYAHASTYSSDVKLDYTVANPEGNPALPPDGARVSFEESTGWARRLALGATLDLILVEVSGEYATGDYDTVSARIAFGLN